MMAELCYNIIDITQNSLAAAAANVFILLEDSIARDKIIIEVKDDGRGMDTITLENVQNPFYTTKTEKKVGLGIPLLKQAALECGGEFVIESQPGQGTRVFTRFQRSHIDTPPVGDIQGTIFTLIVGTAGINIDFTYTTDTGTFNISIQEIKEQVGDVHLTHPEIMKFLRQYINENVTVLVPPVS